MEKSKMGFSILENNLDKIITNNKKDSLAKLKLRTRTLTAGEIELCQLVYKNTIDYSKVTIIEGSFFPFDLQNEDTFVTPNGHIFIPTKHFLLDYSKEDISYKHLFIHEMGLGIVVGYAGGIALSQLLKQVKLDAGLYPVVTLLGGLIIFSGAAVVGGSGFLAAYIGGMTFANNAFSKMMLIKHFNDGMAWIAQLVMLLTLGLLVTPSNMVEYIVPAVMIAVFLMMIARPLAVWVCLIGQKFTTQEKTFVSWVGLRGAIPIYLALIPALSGIENGHYYFNVAFIIVISSLLLQGWTINLLATKLGLSKTGAHKH
jgi:NhaP-type Na+/H+ and K+/H+ antiporter